MSGTQGAIAGPALVGGPRRHRRFSADFAWAIAFVVPYTAVFCAFAAYPIAYALWMGGEPSLYGELVSDPGYVQTLINTLVFVVVAVNLKMFLALLISGFFMRRRWWIKALLVVYILPWALPAISAFTSFHWILIQDGFLDAILEALFGTTGPIWFNNRWLALGSNIVAYIWKWLPFWTLIFLAGRMAIPQDLYEAAEMDGATGPRRFVHVVLPLLANLYLICTLISTLWTVGDFTTVYFVSGGAPFDSSEVLATAGIDYAFESMQPSLGVAVMLSALPILIPIAIVLIRKLQTSEVQL